MHCEVRPVVLRAGPLRPWWPPSWRLQSQGDAGNRCRANSPCLPTERPLLACPPEVTMLCQVANESCQTKSHFEVHFVKNPSYSTFHLLIMLWIRDQRGRNLSVLKINGFCGYLNPRSPLECNSLGKSSSPGSLPPRQ